MDLFDPAPRKFSQIPFRLAGALIGELQRRGWVGPRRTPDHPESDPAEEGAVEQATAEASAERAAWERFVVALERLTEVQAAYALDPDELGAEQVRWAEVELEDAVAVAGEFEVKQIRWLLT